ncbi:MAG: hypothetical protein DMF24_00395 [Verrucomicrobia bacterium]|nr:MAG: hypothetical protein DMF24_00395 [Verrucomicrobiota bacterium]
MKWLTAVLTFVNLSVISGLVLGMAGRGLNMLTAALALVCGTAFAVAAFLGTSDPAGREQVANPPEPERKPRNAESKPNTPIRSALMRYRRVWFWAMAVCFAVFAVRSFCWLFYIDGSDYKIQSPNNLGDLSLHLTLIKTFANAVPLWPDNPIYVHSKLRYPAGIDLFNGLLSLVHVDLITGLCWVGLVACLATFYGFYRWGGSFAVAGFLFNGGIAGFQFFKTWKFLDYQGTAADIAHRPIAWKSIPLSMFVTQRGWLYAIPAALVLFWHWREKFFRQNAVAGGGLSAVASAKADDAGGCAAVSANTNELGQSAAVEVRVNPKGPLPLWSALALYASMPLYNLHTFIALTVVLVFALVLERPSEIKYIVNLTRNEGVSGLGRLTSHPRMWPEIFRGAPIRRHAAATLALALVPASFFVWLVTDHFHAASVLQWHPGWAQDSQEFAAPFFRMGGTANFGSSTMFGGLLQKTWNGVISPFFQFWLTNFGLWVPLALGLLGLVGWRIWKSGWRWGDKPPADVAFVVPALLIFCIGYFFKTAPWEWDNLKLMVWGYFLILPFLWSDILGRWAFPERAAICIALFGSGFVTLLGGLSAGHPGFGLIERARLDNAGAAMRPLPMDARFAAWPTFNCPVLLQGRKAVAGYPGHLWTEGFDYTEVNNRLTALMNGAPNWREAAQSLGVRYIFWGQDEKANYQSSSHPWEATSFLVASGDWGAIYDLTVPAPH